MCHAPLQAASRGVQPGGCSAKCCSRRTRESRLLRCWSCAQCSLWHPVQWHKRHARASHPYSRGRSGIDLARGPIIPPPPPPANMTLSAFFQSQGAESPLHARQGHGRRPGLGPGSAKKMEKPCSVAFLSFTLCWEAQPAFSPSLHVGLWQ